MPKETLAYPLTDGYVCHWLVAGPEAVPVEELHRFGKPPDPAQIIRRYSRPEAGIDGSPVEYGDYKIGEAGGKWRYERARYDHRIDFSAFHPAVRFLSAWAYAEIESPAEQGATMILATNGPADVWINDRHVHRQEHYHPEAPQPVRIPVRLAEGSNRLMVRLETVAARQSPFGMSLKLVDLTAGGGDMRVRIPTPAPAPAYRLKLESIFEGCHIRQDVYARSDPITVYLPEGPAATTPFHIRMQQPGGKIYAEAARDGRRAEPLQPMGSPYLSPEGAYQLRFMPPPLEFYEKNVRITRLREFYASTNVFSTRPYGTYPERRTECLKDAASRRDGLFSEIARMEGGSWKDVDLKAVRQAVGEVRARDAGSVASLCGLLGVLYRYSESEEFPPDLRTPLEECVWNARYWEDEPGEDAMDYRGESECILFHACEILAGQRYPERTFPNAGKSGAWHREKGEARALDWLARRAAAGFEEWNSGACFEREILALSALTSLAENSEVLELAALMLDKIFFTVAVNSFQGAYGSARGCTEAAHVKTAYREPLAGVTRLLWGMGIFNEHILGTVGLASSNYELPPILAAIAADQPEELWSRERHAGSAGAEANLAAYKTPDGMLSSTQDWRPGGRGDREHIWQATLSPFVTVFSTHPACAGQNAACRPNAWRGNARLPRVAQWKDALIAVHRFSGEDGLDFTHAYFPVHGMDQFKFCDGWAFGRVGGGYIALTAARGLDFQTLGDDAYRELRSPGSPNIWICQMGRAARDGGFEEFVGKVLALPVAFEDLRVEMTGLGGDRLSFGWEGPLRINGEEQTLCGFPHYDNPYCRFESGASEMEIRYGEDALRLNFGERAE